MPAKSRKDAAKSRRWKAKIHDHKENGREEDVVEGVIGRGRAHHAEWVEDGEGVRKGRWQLRMKLPLRVVTN